MMKKIILFCVASLFCVWVQAQGISFVQGSWKEVQAMAAQEHKAIFLDVYTSWCGPCKMMANKVFTQKEAGDYFNAHFINYKVDAEKGEGVKIARQYHVDSYPTCLFLTPDGKLVSSFVGAKDVKALLKEGDKALKNYQLLPELEALKSEYNQGNRQKDFLKNYCMKRESFGDKGGKPVYDYVSMLDDEELLQKENAHWIQSIDIYDAALLNRLVHVLETHVPLKSKKEVTPLNNAVMKALSTFIQQATAGNRREMFEHLMGLKESMNRVSASNNDNGVSASMGGGISYLATEQIKLSFYNKNRCDKEFTDVFLAYIQQKMLEHPVDSLIKHSDEEELTYSRLMKSDSISVEDKKEIKQGRDLMKMFNGVKFQLLASTLYNAASHYWELKQPADDSLKAQYITWLNFFYVLHRSSEIAIPVSEKMKELGAVSEARRVLEDLLAFLALQEETEADREKVRKVLDAI